MCAAIAGAEGSGAVCWPCCRLAAAHLVGVSLLTEVAPAAVLVLLLQAVAGRCLRVCQFCCRPCRETVQCTCAMCVEHATGAR